MAQPQIACRNMDVVVDEITGIGIFTVGKFQIPIFSDFFIGQGPTAMAATLAAWYMGQEPPVGPFLHEDVF